MTQKILAIGNAIVDILSKTQEEFLEENNLIKGSMSLIDEETANKLATITAEKTSSGGSAGNTIATLAQLGAKTAFIGKVGNDDFGSKFISEIEKTGTEFVSNKNHNDASAKSFILVTPDAQRTMCTFLGCASQITESDIDPKIFKDTSILYLEGYLWDAPSTINALKKAIRLAKENGVKVAFSLSDSFCVSRHKDDFLALIQNDLDILFANEAEAQAMSDNFAELVAQNSRLTAIVTKSDRGCDIFSADTHFSLPTEKVANLVDTTGAGDAFAAGLLFGLNNDFDLTKSATLANVIAGKIIQKFGARFDQSEIKELHNALV